MGYRIRRQLTPTSLFLGLLLGIAIPGSISGFRMLMRGRIAPANVRRLSGGAFFSSGRGGQAGAAGEGERSLLTRTKATTTVVSGGASSCSTGDDMTRSKAGSSGSSSLMSAAASPKAASSSSTTTTSIRQEDDQDKQNEEEANPQGGEGGGGAERQQLELLKERGAVTSAGAEDSSDDEEEDDDEPALTDEDLSTIVSQRGADLSRMNGAASHLALAHSIWGQVLRPGGTVVDATCGNGHDSLVLARYLFPSGVPESTWGVLHCMDIQQAAIDSTRQQLLANPGSPLAGQKEGAAALLDRHVRFHVGNFRELPRELAPESVHLLVYNLGYLPGSRDKHITTTTRDTLESLRQALFTRPLLAVRGLVSIMCYRGHPEGAKETAAVLDFVEGLDPMVWRAFQHAPLNRPLSPLLITIYRLK